MSQPEKLVAIEKETTTLSELEAKKFITFRTREIASFLKYVHDILSQNDVNKAKQMIAEFLKGLADLIR